MCDNADLGHSSPVCATCAQSPVNDLAGAAGAALYGYALENRWIHHIGTGRAVALTDAGRDALREHLGIALDQQLQGQQR